MLLTRPGVALVLPVVTRYSNIAPLSNCVCFTSPWARGFTSTRAIREGVLGVTGSLRRGNERKLRKKSRGILYPQGTNRMLGEEAVMAEKAEDMVVSDRTEQYWEEEHDPSEVAGLRIVKYPHPSLRAKNTIITEFNLDLVQLSRNMFEMMYAAKGAGLAAPQVDLNKKLMVFNLSGDKKQWTQEVVCVNPKIVQQSKTEESDEEGCLSFPNLSLIVPRSKWIKVEYDTVKGKHVKRKIGGLEARVFQHEYDHLEGITFIDRLSREERLKVQGRLDELVKDYGYGGAL